jgi:hypothetical protein
MINKTSSQFKRGVKEEAHEHPSFSKKQIDTVVTDHLKIHPFMYRR